MTDATFSNGELRTTREQCEYEAGRLALCAAPRGPVRIRRDARGRITLVQEGDNALSVTYDDKGDVITLVGSNGYVRARLSYDGARRLIAEIDLRGDDSEAGATRYEYDALGRFVHANLGDETRRYDAVTGLLVEIVERISNGSGLARQTTTFTYDTRRRPIRVVEVTVPEGVAAAFERDREPERTERRYDYDCAPR